MKIRFESMEAKRLMIVTEDSNKTEGGSDADNVKQEVIKEEVKEQEFNPFLREENADVPAANIFLDDFALGEEIEQPRIGAPNKQ